MIRKRIKIVCVVGARPNFIKIAPLIEEIKKDPQMRYVLVHTGQHYDFEMSKIFFRDLKIPKPHYNLEGGSGSHAWQTAKIMERLEPILLKENPNLIVIVGDVNSTLAGALTAAKLHFPVAHIEAGLRSFDMLMPEEINRRLTDHISDYLFITEPQAIKNLIKEGISRKKIFYVGNIMIDTLLKNKKIALGHSILKKIGLREKDYSVLTIHRPENVDHKNMFKEIIETIKKIQKEIKIVWPIHPRTKKRLKHFNLIASIKKLNNLIILPPLGYLEMLNLMALSKFVMTDSGGIQEETTTLDVPCLTFREVTERPITRDIGTNIVVGIKKDRIIKEVKKILGGYTKKNKIPRYWDGKTAKRIVVILKKKLIEYEK